MSSPETKQQNDGQDSSGPQPAMRELAINPSAIQGFIGPPTGSLPNYNFHVKRVRFPIEHRMERFMPYLLRLPGAHILGRIIVVNAAILKMHCALFNGGTVSLFEVTVSKPVQFEGGESPPQWIPLSKAFLRLINGIHVNRIDNYILLSSHLNKDSVMRDLGAMASESNIGLDNKLNPNGHQTSLEELKKRETDLRKLLDEPCSSDMASKLQEELHKNLMRQAEWQHKKIHTSDNEIDAISQIFLNDSPNADQSKDQEYHEEEFDFPLLDELDEMYPSSEDDMLGFDSGIVKKEITIDKVQLEKSLEQENYTRCKQEVLRVSHDKGGDITMANVMEQKPASNVSQYFMASLMLASENKMELQNKGQKGEPTSIDQLFMKKT